MKPQPVLHLTLAKIMQVRLPVTVLDQVIRQMFRNKYVAGISTIHDTLRHVDARAGDIHHVVYIDDAVDRPAVNSHAKLDVRMTLQTLTDFQSASRRLFWTMKKKKRHPVSGWQPNELATCFRSPKTLGAAHELI
jgi:hypothetical protein